MRMTYDEDFMQSVYWKQSFTQSMQHFETNYKRFSLTGCVAILDSVLPWLESHGKPADQFKHTILTRLSSKFCDLQDWSIDSHVTYLNYYINSELYHQPEIADLEGLLQFLQRKVDTINLELLEQAGDQNNLKLMQQEVVLWKGTISNIVQILPNSPSEPNVEDAPSGGKLKQLWQTIKPMMPKYSSYAPLNDLGTHTSSFASVQKNKRADVALGSADNAAVLPATVAPQQPTASLPTQRNLSA